MTQGRRVKNMDDGAVSAKGKPARRLGREIFSWLILLVAAVAIALPVRAYLFEPLKVDGESMRNTLQDGEVLIVTKPGVLLGHLHRGDVVICRYPNRSKTSTFQLGAMLDVAAVGSELFVKRLVALPGDAVAVAGGKLYVNDAQVEEAYVDYPAWSDYPRRVLGENEYMVMGDNRASSHDSRSRDVGPISRDMIVGHASLVVYPFSRIRAVH